MSASIEDIFEVALTLVPDDRGILANQLLKSMEPSDADSVRAKWAEVVERRVREVRAGTAKLHDVNDVLAELRARKH